MSTNSIIIIAAGQSTRMNSKTPKVLHKIAERPALAYVLETSVSSNPTKIILVTSPAMEDVRAFANQCCNSITHVIQENPLGTGDAVKVALPHLDNNGKTLILYGDCPFISSESITQLNQRPQDFTLVSFYTNEPNKYGRLITFDDDLLEIIEYTEASDEQKLITHCNSGIISIKNSYLKKLIPLIKNRNLKKEYYLTDIVKLAFHHDIKCNIFNVDESEVIGFNTREDLSKAEAMMQAKIKAKLMNNGVTIIQPETSYIAYDFKAGVDVVIYPNVFIGQNVILGDNVTIKSFTHLEGTNIADSAIIGPFARIRPETSIAENVKIGNFVEIKNSIIRKSTKINHLSYIGDTDVGQDTNIGAGSITCNFDGIKTKARTKIGNEVSIGSNVCLIAPIEIADKSFIAAGSVINENVAENDLAVARSKQINLKSGAEKLRKKKNL